MHTILPLLAFGMMSFMAPRVPRTQLDHVLLGSTPGERSRWAQATGRAYDIRVDEYGPQDYSVSVNIDRIRRGTVGWICHRDGGLGAIAGLIVFSSGKVEHEPESGVNYLPGVIWPLPREYWIDGGRLMQRGWTGSPFKTGPSQFRNGQEAKPENMKILYREIAPVVADWLLFHPLRN